jgi:hypothetical protein
MTALRAQGRRGFDGVTSSGCRGLEKDDGTTNPGRARVIGVAGSGMAHGTQHCGLGDEACIVDGTTGLDQGRWRCVRTSTVVGNDSAEASGRTRWRRGGSREDSTMARALRKSTTERAPGKFSTRNFGSLMVWVKASGFRVCKGRATVYL